MKLPVTILLLTNLHLALHSHHKEVQWDEIETLINTYLCTGDTSWTDNERIPPRLRISVMLPTDMFCQRPIHMVEYLYLMEEIWATMDSKKKSNFTQCTSRALDHMTKMLFCCRQFRGFLHGLTEILQSTMCEEGKELAREEVCSFLSFLSSDEGKEEFYRLFTSFCSGCEYPSRDRRSLDVTLEETLMALKSRFNSERQFRNVKLHRDYGRLLRLTRSINHLIRANNTGKNYNEPKKHFTKLQKNMKLEQGKSRERRQYDQASLVHVLQDLACGKWYIPLPERDEGATLRSTIIVLGKLGCCFFKILL